MIEKRHFLCTITALTMGLLSLNCGGNHDSKLLQASLDSLRMQIHTQEFEPVFTVTNNDTPWIDKFRLKDSIGGFRHTVADIEMSDCYRNMVQNISQYIDKDYPHVLSIYINQVVSTPSRNGIDLKDIDLPEVFLVLFFFDESDGMAVSCGGRNVISAMEIESEEVSVLNQFLEVPVSSISDGTTDLPVYVIAARTPSQRKQIVVKGMRETIDIGYYQSHHLSPDAIRKRDIVANVIRLGWKSIYSAMGFK
jgi:hypothetical protein